jgi:DNA-binding GntR family transcriptional regulator
LNREFHAVLYSGVNRPRLGRQIALLYDAFDRYLRVEHSQLERHAQSQQEHRRILDACRRGNMTVALGELASHIGDAGDQLGALLRSRVKAR